MLRISPVPRRRQSEVEGGVTSRPAATGRRHRRRKRGRPGRSPFSFTPPIAALACRAGFGKCGGRMAFPHSSSPNPPAREPAINLPAVVVWLLAALALIQGLRSLLSDYDDYVLMSWLAFVPARLTLWLAPERIDDVIGAMAQTTG